MKDENQSAQELSNIIDQEKSRMPRICMPSLRKVRGPAFRGAIYEAEDVLVAMDDVDLICMEPRAGFGLGDSILRSLVWHDFTKKLGHVNPGLRTVRIKREYDLFVAICQNWGDLLLLNAIKGWKDYCRTSVCWIEEMWAAWIPRYKNWIHVLDDFDHVIVNPSGSVRAMEEVLGRQCHWVPAGIDVLRFSPYPSPPARIIDVYSIGRRWEGVHRALLDLVESQGIFYMYDTIDVNTARLPDHGKHRDMISNIAKRSRYFIVAPAKMDKSHEKKGQSEIGHRYHEGAAAGSVLLGNKPESESFQDFFGWQDSVIEIKPDGSDLARTLSDLSGQPERLTEISRRNCREMLLRHDWVYRWKRIYQIAGLEPSPGLEARVGRLEHLAGLATKDMGNAP